MRKFAVLLVVLAVESYGQRIPITSKPSWVKDYPYSVELKDTTNASDGYYDVVSNTQFNNTQVKEYFHQTVQKVLSTKGLENVSTITQNFDPSYERLSFHWINVIRNGKKIDQLKLGEFRVLKREQNLERLMYDGEMSAVFNLYDVQVGDILDYAYSVRGGNPNTGDKSSRVLYFNYSVPVGLIIRRVVTDANRSYQLKKFNTVPDPQVTLENGKRIYEWALHDVPALLGEESTPGWFDAYNHIQISDFGSWEDLSTWAAELYKTSATTKRLLPKIPGIEKENKEESIRKLIRFVQDEIRYLSFSEGIHGYKPHAPDKILEQRFGDCKDKSFLLATLLTELGIKSQPVLVNTSYGKSLPEYLPSPGLFDHCIVSYEYHDSTHWVDPTYSLQRGPIDKTFMQNYYHGLPVSANAKGLVSIGFGDGGKIEADLTLLVEELSAGGAKLTVRTTYSGAEADDMRSYFQSNSISEIEKKFLNYYANDYPDIRSIERVKWTDNENRNVIVTEESYKITEFWKYDTDIKKFRGPTYAREISTHLSKPKTTVRTSPYSISFPVTVIQNITVRLPEEWNLKSEEEKIESAGFVFTSAARYEGRVLELNYAYKSKKPFVDAVEVRDHVTKIDDALNSLSYDLSYANDSNNKTSSTSIIITILAIVTLYLSYRWFIKPRLR